jgi:hypothetical protein
LNAGKEIEAMKRLTLHHIASSLYRFIASVAHLCVTMMKRTLDPGKAVLWHYSFSREKFTFLCSVWSQVKFM